VDCSLLSFFKADDVRETDDKNGMFLILVPGCDGCTIKRKTDF
jgi:hypothetical protein